MTNFPTTLDSFVNPQPTDNTVTVDHAGQHDNINDAVKALETKLGIDTSAVVTTIDYLLKNVASVDPGHKHSISSLSATGGADATKVLYGDNSWKVPPAIVDASAAVKGATRLTKDPASPTAPIAIGANTNTLSTTPLDETSNKIVDQAFAPETTGNKSTNATTDKASDTKYPSVKAITTYVDNINTPSNTTLFLSVVSTNIRTNDNSLVSTYNTTPTKLKEILHNDTTGTINVYFTIYGDSGGNPYGQIYKNGIAVGTLRNVGTSPANFTESISVTTGDLIQIYAYDATGSHQSHITNFQLQYDKSPKFVTNTVNL